MKISSLLSSLLISLFLIGFSSGYSFDNPNEEHTNQAIKFDGQGKPLESLKAFQSAVKFKPTSETYTNLGVCLMRLGTASQDRDTKVDYYHKASAAMTTAKERAVTEAEWEHVRTNIAALLQSMNAEQVEQDEDTKLDPMESPKLKKKKKKVTVEPSTLPSLDGDGAFYRERLLHQRDVPIAGPLPRISVQQMESGDPKLERFRDRLDPFILTGAMEGWGALELWPDNWKSIFAERYADVVTDFYPFNMLSKDRQAPYLTRVPRAIQEVFIDPATEDSKFTFDRTALQGRYMHMQLTPKQWVDLEERGDIDPNRHWHMRSDQWMEECLGFPHSTISEEFHLKNHWKIILAGSRGAGMFNHSDSLMTSSWHSHIMGSKWWYVCGRLSTGESRCFEDYLVPGETLYYGTGWYHETQNLETPTMTITDTVYHKHNFARINDMVHATCVENKMRFEYSAELCDAMDVCYNTLHQMHRGKPKSDKRWRSWRKVANKHYVKRAEAIDPTHNNYDGRNHITE